MAAEIVISTDEAAQYDRQIRLWGLEAQKRLRNSSVLVIGTRGLAAEVCKNVVLSGVKRLTVLDDEIVQGDRQFLISPDKEGKNRAFSCIERLQQLNPMVEIKADDEKIMEKEETFFSQFDAVCLIRAAERKIMLHVSDVCRRHGIKFFCGAAFGYFGYFFVDLGIKPYRYVEEEKTVESLDIKGGVKKKRKMDTVKMVEREITSVSLNSALDFHPKQFKNLKRLPKVYLFLHVWLAFFEEFGRFPYFDCKSDEASEEKLICNVAKRLTKDWDIDLSLIPSYFYNKCGKELVPVCAILGGVLSQEIIKVLSGRDAPIDNFFCYNGIENSGLVHHFGQCSD